MQKISFLNELAFGDKPKVTPLLETPFSKEIRICMSKGNLMKEHTAPGAITIMLLSGKLVIGSQGEEIVLDEGDMVYFEPKVPHSLEAMNECVVRLVLSKQDSIQRVQGIIGSSCRS